MMPRKPHSISRMQLSFHYFSSLKFSFPPPIPSFSGRPPINHVQRSSPHMRNDLVNGQWPKAKRHRELIVEKQLAYDMQGERRGWKMVDA